MGPGENEVLGVMLISNNFVKSMRSDGKRGDYSARLWKKRNAASVIAANQLGAGWDYRPLLMSEVINFPRRSYHVWNLVRAALNEMAPGRGVI